MACAKQVRPTGGDKDVTPPAVRGSVPQDGSTNFQGKEIRIEFDEYVQLKDIENELFVSPFTLKKPSVRLKGKSVILEFQEDLKDDVTYTVDFGSGIVDVNESNPAVGLKYVFSTGPEIDSLSVMGSVAGAADGMAVENIYVGLYEIDGEEQDSILYKNTPKYLSRTDKAGNFRMAHIKAGAYRVYALKDDNNNYLFDQGTESVAFLDSVLVVNDSTGLHDIKLQLFNEGMEKPKQISKSHEEYGHCQIIYSAPMRELKTTVLDTVLSAENQMFINSENGDTINLWYKDSYPSQLQIRVESTEVVGDTVKFKKTIDPEMKKSMSVSVANSRKGSGLHSIPYQAPLRLKVNHPIARLDFEKFELKKDSTNLALSLDLLEEEPMIFSLDHSWIADSVYSVILYPGAITDYLGNENDTLSFSVKSRSLDSYGNLILLLGQYPDSIPQFYQLFDAKARLKFQGILADTILQFPRLEPDTYEFRVVQDDNENQEWDTGNLLQAKQPEGIRFFRGIVVKPNWDTEYEIKLE